MSYLKASPEQIRQLRALPPATGPVRMLNLLRFRERTADGTESGQKRYRRYMTRVAPILGEVRGELIFSGEVGQTIIGPEGPEAWDLLLIVEYPTLEHFLRVPGHPDYPAIAEDRTSALADSRLILLT